MRYRGLGALAGAVALMAISTPAIAAEPSEANGDGYWYYDWLGYGDLHASGIDGSGVTIAVIDSALNPDVSSLAGADISVHDSMCLDQQGQLVPPTSTDYEVAQHGTDVLGFLVGNGEGGAKGVAPGASILYYSLTGDMSADSDSTYGVCSAVEQSREASSEFTLAIREAVADGADIISISAGDDFASTEVDQEAIMAAAKAGVIVVASTPNFASADEFFVTYPAGFNGVVAVGAHDPDGNPATARFNTTGEVIGIDVRAPGVDMMVQGVEGDWSRSVLGSGASYATPIVAGTLALAKQAHPDATANQLLQALARTTYGNDAHELNLDPAEIVGYGILDPTTLIATDPTQYPDENPMVVDAPDTVPTVEQWTAYMAAGAGAEATPSASVESSPQASPEATQSTASGEDAESGSAWVLPVIIGVALALIGGTVAAVVIALKANRKERVDA